MILPETTAIYLHIPFCKQICTYCAFNTYADRELLYDAYVNALLQEIAAIAQHDIRLEVSSIYFGGGTPSILEGQQIVNLIERIRARCDVHSDSEVTLEANPSDITLQKAAQWRDAGINRLSIGMQSANLRELTLYGRDHSLATVITAVEMARAVGFENISLDLIFGNPGQTMREWLDTMQAAVSLQPEHISLYGLEVHGGTVLKTQLLSKQLRIPKENLIVEMYETARATMSNAGFMHYEISNFALAGYESRHNSHYWHNLPYLGLGAGAHGYANGVRTIVVRSPEKYIQAMGKKGTSAMFPRTPATSKATVVTPADAVEETIMMGLRLIQAGIQRAEFQSRFGFDVVETRQAVVDRLIELGMIQVTTDALRISEKGYLLSTPIIAQLVTP